MPNLAPVPHARAAAERMNPRPTRRWPQLAGVLPAAAVFLAAALLRLVIAGNSDVSWGITVAEKILAGARLYVDVIEVNPPASIYLYLPQTALARALSLKPEWLVDASAFFAAALSLWFTARIVRRNRLLPAGVSETAALAVMAFVLTLLPMRIFAEREHFALIAALPAIAVLAAMAGGKTVSPAVQIVAGIGAGLMAACKPYLAFGIIFAALAAALKARSWRPLFALQNWCAAIVCIVYAIWIWRAFPVFVSDILPFVADTYVPMRFSLAVFVFRSGLTLWLLALVLLYYFMRRAIFRPALFVPLAASGGFILAYVVQGKAYPYQSYPALALICFLLALGFIGRFHQPRRASGEDRLRIVSAATVAVIVALAALWFNLALDFSGLRAPVSAIKPHPKIITLSDDLGLGFPLVRDLGGEWVGRKPSLWVTTFARDLQESSDPAARARYAAYVAAERKIFTEDVVRGQPDIILLWRSAPGQDWLSWANGDPRLAEALKAYRPRGTVDGVTILSR